MSLADGTGPGTHDVLVGHERAMSAFEEATRSGKLHHGWLITGPEGIGKATLAYRMARYLIAGAGGRILDHTLSDATGRKIAGEAHPNLLVLERAMDATGKRRKTELTVDVIRKLNAFFGTTAGEGGWRVAIVDSANEMNASAANALLKNLEEPPDQTILILVSHRPGRLLPTIRSRCRVLPLKPLASEQVQDILAQLPDLMASPEERVAAAGLAAGAPGRAVALLEAAGLDLVTTLKALLAQPTPDWAAIHALASSFQSREAESQFQIMISTWRDETAAAVRHAVSSGQIARANELANYSESFNARLDEALGLNLDKRQFILDAFDRWHAITSPAGALG
ncbi:MAG: DNA polymerase III subunit delta' [Pseudomonadota bacterium]